MAEETVRLASLSVLGGSLHGRRLDLEEAVTEVLIGSDADCHLALDLPTISPIHARIWAELSNVVVHDTHAPRGVYVNTDRVHDQAPLREGDVIWLGPPQEPGSICIQCRFEPWVEVLPAVVSGEAPPPTPAAPPDAYEPTVLEEGPGETSAEPSTGPPAEEPSAVEEPAHAEEAPAVASSGPTTAEDREAEPVALEPEAFFVGAAASSGPEVPPPPAPAAEHEAILLGEDNVEAAAPPSVEMPAPGDAAPSEDAWVIAEPAAPAPPAEATAGSDDFFITEEPGGPRPAPPRAETPPLVATSRAAGGPPIGFELPPLEPTGLPPAASAPEPAPRPRPAPPSPKPGPRAEPRVPRPSTPPTPSAAPPSPAAELAAAKPSPASDAARVARPSPAPAEPGSAATPTPAAARPAPRERPAARPAARRPAAHPVRPTARAARGGGVARYAVIGVVVVAALGAVAVLAPRLLGERVVLEAVEPQRARVGQKVALRGTGFSADAARNVVRFGDQTARVLTASPGHLEVEVPEVVSAVGSEGRFAVTVRRGRRESAPIEVSVFQGPRLHGLSPDVAMPGETLVLAGAGWGVGASVRFGDVPAELVDIQATQIRAVVPALPGGPGTEAPVIVTVGGVDSNSAPFLIGRLPLVTSVEPAEVTPGDVVTVSGRGFRRTAAENDVRIGGALSLVVSAFDTELKVVVPRPATGAPTLELRVPGSEQVGQAGLKVAPPPEVVELRFVAGPFDAVPGRPYAVISTGLGPAFVLAASGGRSAADRALEAQRRLNEAATVLKATRGLGFEVRDLATRPVVGLIGRPEVVLEVAEEDAAAYNEDWTRLRGRGGPVTPARLARWWEAVANDLALLLVRGERPQFASALATEGRVLGQVFEAAQRTGRFGVPFSVVAEARPPIRDGLRLLALRVPASVTAPVAPAAGPAPGAAPAALAPTPSRLVLDGTWIGSEVEDGLRRYLTVSFRGSGGTVAYEGGITLTVPMMAVEQPGRDQVRFTMQFRGGIRHYVGKWDGQTISGTVARDPEGKSAIATFELRQR